jgi:hypothetical protein
MANVVKLVFVKFTILRNKLERFSLTNTNVVLYKKDSSLTRI